jgi:tetratricopeptide (TPR) repeat protein
MLCWWGIFAVSAALALSPANAQESREPAKQQEAPKQEEPPEEDDSRVGVKEYSFNPLQAEKELQIGKFYFKKRSYKAAAQRFKEATLWNNGLVEAYLRLAEACEKLGNYSDARAAYAKYADLEEDEKKAQEARERLKKLPLDKGK